MILVNLLPGHETPECSVLKLGVPLNSVFHKSYLSFISMYMSAIAFICRLLNAKVTSPGRPPREPWDRRLCGRRLARRPSPSRCSRTRCGRPTTRSAGAAVTKQYVTIIEVYSFYKGLILLNNYIHFIPVLLVENYWENAMQDNAHFVNTQGKEQCNAIHF